MSDIQAIKAIVERYLNGTATEQEKNLVESWYNQHQVGERPQLDIPELENELAQIRASLDGSYQSVKVRRLSYRTGIAAAIAFALLFGAYYFIILPKNNLNTANNQAAIILPKTKGVTLTTANGQQIAVNYGHSGQITSGVNQQDSLLNYSNTNSNKAAEPVFNTVTNNSGRKFGLQLADGSEVILDIQSSLTYPVAFTQETRTVTMTGQAYFKVKHDQEHPFNVKVKDQLIQDLGTEFNVKSYDSIATTLISGAVKVNSGKNSIELQPGQTATGAELTVTKANLEIVTAWLQDQMVLKRTPLATIMAEVARIYDIKVIWQDEHLRTKKIGGRFNRRLPLANILESLRKTANVDFKVEGNTVTVLNKKS